MERDAFFRDARADVDGPLHGIRVLDVTKVWAGPLATCILADLGAEVIRVELPGGLDGDVPPRIPGTGESWFRQTVNRNKRSVAIDLRTGAGRETFLAMVGHADLVVENYRPGTLDRWGVGHTACRLVRESIVFVSISGYGQYGPRSHLPGYDPVVQAYGGWMALNGSRAPTFIADELAGLHAAIGALAALRHRDVTGEGQHVDVSMLDSLLAGSSGLLTLAATGVQLAAMGNETNFVVPANVYQCLDGSVYLAVALNRQWRALAAAVGRPELARKDGYATAQARLANRKEVNRVISQWCAPLPVANVVAVLENAGIPAAPVRHFAEVAHDPQVHARDMLQSVELSGGGRVPLTGPAVKFSRTPTRIRHAAPQAGADTETVFRALTVSVTHQPSPPCPDDRG